MSSGCARPEWQFSGPRKLADRRPCKRGRRRSPRLERGRRSRSIRPGKLLSKTKSWLRKDCGRKPAACLLACRVAELCRDRRGNVLGGPEIFARHVSQSHGLDSEGDGRSPEG